VDRHYSEYFLVVEGTVQGYVLGPILFNLFIRPLMEMANSLAFADNSYHYGASKKKQHALEILQVKLKAAIEWITGSGLKVKSGKERNMCFSLYGH